ncbi:hypothetical protein [Salmonella enterica]|uniref:hypothetical protein n=1 Tax=Salmonella enterica TaxID=28901 RepID=UPI00122DADB3|nr:hypothetical protein [Salmonella enterica]
MTPVKITGYFFWLEVVKRSVKIWLAGCGKQLYQYEKHWKLYPQSPLKCHDSAPQVSPFRPSNVMMAPFICHNSAPQVSPFRPLNVVSLPGY